MYTTLYTTREVQRYMSQKYLPAIRPKEIAPMPIKEVRETAELLMMSGCFKDTASVAQACVKIIAGHEYGFAPFISMNGIHIIQGKPVLSSNLVGAAVKRYCEGRKYDFRVIEKTEKLCRLEVIEWGEPVGIQDFSWEDAVRAGVADKDIWKKYPRAMLFARCLTEAARTYCSDVFGGPVYSPEDFDHTVDQDGNLLDEKGKIVIAEQQPEPANGQEPPEAPAPKQTRRAPKSPTPAQSAAQSPPASDSQANVTDAEVVATGSADSPKSQPQSATGAEQSSLTSVDAPSSQTGAATAASVTSNQQETTGSPVATAEAPTSPPAAAVDLKELQAQIKTALRKRDYLDKQAGYICMTLFNVIAENVQRELPARFKEIIEWIENNPNPFPGKEIHIKFDSTDTYDIYEGAPQ